MTPCPRWAGAAVALALAIAGCSAPPVAVSIEQRLDRHMTAASKLCAIDDWRKIFDTELRGPHIRLRWHEPPAAGRAHPREAAARCLLGTFGSVTATPDYFEVATSALRTTIEPRRID